MLVAAHQGRLNTPDKNGVSQRVHLEGLLERETMPADKRAKVLAELEGPEFPETMWYLWDRFELLNGMRHEGMSGPAPFTPEMLLAADRLFGWHLTPLEANGLRLLDGAYRVPKILEEPTE